MSAKVPIEQQIAALSAQVSQLSEYIRNGFNRSKSPAQNTIPNDLSVGEISVAIEKLLRAIVNEEEDKLRVLFSNNPDLFEVWITQHKQALETLPKILSKIAALNHRFSSLESQLSKHTDSKNTSMQIKWSSYKNPYLISTFILIDLIIIYIVIKCIS